MFGRMVKLILAVLLVLITGAAFAEEATLIPANTTRITVAPSYGMQFEEWDWEGVSNKKVSLFNLGLGVEYGPSDWINLQVLWVPGVNLWSKIDGGDYGRMSDLFVGFKTAILGKGALFDSDKLRFSVAPGMKMPVASFNAKEKADTIREPDQHLWGSALRLSFDYITNPFSFINFYLEGVFYPSQWTDNPAYKTNMVKHYVDINAEMEVHFHYPLENGIVLKGGVPFTLFAAPVMNANDEKSYSQYRLGSGAYFGAVFPGTPLELLIRYSAPFMGKNAEPLHRVSLIARLSFGPSK